MGGSVPASGAHSIIDNPEPVSRVTPPSTTITSTMNATQNSQMATRRRVGRPAARSSGGAPGKSRTSKGMSQLIEGGPRPGDMPVTKALLQAQGNRGAADRWRLHDAGRCHPHRMHTGVKFAIPKLEKLAQYGEPRCQIDFLPDEALQDSRVVGHVVKDLGRCQAIV